MEKGRTKFDKHWNSWHAKDHMDFDKISKKIIGENTNTDMSETTRNINLENCHNYIFEKDKLLCRTKCTSKWGIGYKYYEKALAISKIISQIHSLRNKYKKVTNWAVILPKEHAEKYSQKLAEAGISTIAETEMKKVVKNDISEKNLIFIKKENAIKR